MLNVNVKKPKFLLDRALGDPANAMRKSEAAAHIGNDEAHPRYGCDGRREEIKEDPVGKSPNAAHGFKSEAQGGWRMAPPYSRNERSKIGSLNPISGLANLALVH